MKSFLLAIRSASRTSTVAGTFGRRVGTRGRRASDAGFARIQPVRLAYSKTFDSVEAYRAFVDGSISPSHLAKTSSTTFQSIFDSGSLPKTAPPGRTVAQIRRHADRSV